jgi:hypothetical protein
LYELLVQVLAGERPCAVGWLALSKDNLRQAQLAVAEVALAAGEPKVAQAVELFVEHLDDLGLVGAVFFTPQPQSLGVVPPEILAVDRPQPTARQACFELGNGGQVPTRKDVLVDPGVGGTGLLLRNGVQHRNTARLQQLRDLAEVLVAVTAPHVFEHSHADDAIERFSLQVLVVDQAELHQVVHSLALGEFAGTLELFLAERDTQHLHAVLLCRGHRQVTPAAADVQHTHAELQTQLAQQVVDLLLLCLLQRVVDVPEVRARVQARAVQEHVVVVVPHVVVGLDVRLLRLFVVAVPPKRLPQRSGQLVLGDELEQERELIFFDLHLPVHVTLAQSQARVQHELLNHPRIGDFHRQRRSGRAGQIAVVANYTVPVLYPDMAAFYQPSEYLVGYHVF